jgi:hypothetical protein
MISYEQSIISMDKKYFNYKRELRQLFNKSVGAKGFGGTAEADDEETRQIREDQELMGGMEGASKRQQRKIKLMSKRNQ